MAQTKDGALKLSARATGLTVDEYLVKIKNGLKWCTGCKGWHHYSLFGLDSSRRDGLSQFCFSYRKILYKRMYKPRSRISKKGERFSSPRDGDKKQARARVNHLVYIGLLPNPNSLECSTCHGGKKSKRIEYHHHNGYSKEFHEDVIPVCSTCHAVEHGNAKKKTSDSHGKFKNKSK